MSRARPVARWEHHLEHCIANPTASASGTRGRVSVSSSIRKDDIRWREGFLIAENGAALACQAIAYGVQRDRVEGIDSVRHEIEAYLAGPTIEGPSEITGLPATEHRFAEAVHRCERKTAIRHFPAGLCVQDVARRIAQYSRKQDQHSFRTQ